MLKPPWPLARFGTTDCANRYQVGPSFLPFVSFGHRCIKNEPAEQPFKSGGARGRGLLAGFRNAGNSFCCLVFFHYPAVRGIAPLCTKPLCNAVMMIYFRVEAAVRNLPQARIYLLVIQLRLLASTRDGLNEVSVRLRIKSIASRKDTNFKSSFSTRRF